MIRPDDMDYRRNDFSGSYTPYKGSNFGNMTELVEMSTPSQLISKEPTYNVEKHQPFTRDDFYYMITRTYSEFYGKFKDQMNPDEFMEVVDNEELVKRFNTFLNFTDENILTIQNVP